MLNFENQYYSEKINYIAGCDEAGRGPLCGPVVACSVILQKGYQNEDINDSKKLTEKKREFLYNEIINNCVAYGIGIVDSNTIDKINIYEASRLAMKIALKNMNHKIDLILTDAMPLSFNDLNAIPIIKGDSKCQCIAAASIIAKVTRDHLMYEYDKKYPMYDFKNNKGYGTKSHLEALEKYGPIVGFHRKTYGPVKRFYIEKIKLF